MNGLSGIFPLENFIKLGVIRFEKYLSYSWRNKFPMKTVVVKKYMKVLSEHKILTYQQGTASEVAFC